MSAVLSISAVDPATDQLTVTAHGLNNGDGPALAYAAGGALPGGLTAGADVYAIVVDANTLKLASSSTNAFAGTAIDITSAGSGLLYLMLGLPYRRNTTYAPKSQIKSADLNALQDDDVQQWAAPKHGTRTLVISGMAMLPFGAGTVSYTYDHGVSNVTDALDVAVGLSLPLGARILAIRAKVKDSATGPTKLSAFLADADGAGGVVTSAAAASAGDGTNQTLSVAGLATVVTSGHSYAVVVGTTTGTASVNVYGVEVDYDAP